jgi:hypothetical protein
MSECPAAAMFRSLPGANEALVHDGQYVITEAQQYEIFNNG